ncbi:MAG: mannitol-1-phosphate 5-dehydrogenase, partial [Elusimicrobiota bacterium]
SESGYEVVFIDVMETVISALNTNKGYTIKIVGDNPKEIKIQNVRAVNSKDTAVVAEEVKSADILCTAVGVNILPKIAPLIAKGISFREKAGITQPLNIIICENLLDSSEHLRLWVKENCTCHEYVDKYVGMVESVVSRMIPVVPAEIREKDPTIVFVEEYSVLPVDKKGFRGETPVIKGVIPQGNFKGYEERKLFIHNLGHSMYAYLGYLKGYEYIWQAVEDKKLVSIVTAALKESGTALIKKHGFTQNDMDNHITDLFHRFQNKELGDTVARVGRDPLRKLGYNDRLIGSARTALSYGITPENIAVGIAAALRYDNPADPQAVELQKLVKTQSIAEVLNKFSSLPVDSAIIKLVTKTFFNLIKLL